MRLTLFDLDNTLITHDSDYLWGQYLVKHKIVDPVQYEEKNRQFFEDYEKGTLNIDSYLKFALKPLSEHPVQQLYEWRANFVQSCIEPIIARGAKALIEQHRARGDTLMIISATNLFITQPIADLLNIPNILATQPEIVDGRYTGNYLGIPTFQQGKVRALRQWLKEHQMNLSGSTFYSDSHNDLPLLEQVDFPVAVNPDRILQQTAASNHWPVIDLRSLPTA
jgi:HAD superfamily hydrolase (TIGR01490 family)